MSDPIFRLQNNPDEPNLPRDQDDVFFEEAVFGQAKSAQEPARSFVGTVIEGRRLRIGLVVCFTLLGLLVARTAQLQIISGDEYRDLAEQNRVRHRIIPAERGLIYDRLGLILADNVPTFSLLFSPSRLPTSQTEQTELYQKLSLLTGIASVEIEEKITVADQSDETILITDELPYEAGIIVAGNRQDYAAVDLEVTSSRRYVTGNIPTLSHLLGFTGVISPEEYAAQTDRDYRRFDVIGKQGIEKYYETALRGTFGEETIEVDAFGNAERIIAKLDPVDGQNLTLTVDSALQAYIENSISDHLAGTQQGRASVIVMEPKTGEIRALVSYPAYDANLFIGGIDSESYNALLNDPNQPLFPRAVSGEFASGSTIKPVYAAAALMEGIITPSTSFVSVGGFAIGPYFFKDWKTGGHGVTNVYHAIADSVNTFFYIIGGGNESFDGLGVEKLMSYAALFGFGEPTGIDLPGEADGFLPSKQWKEETYGERWYIGDTYNVSIGQGNFISTPLQIARSTAIFANGGYLVRPKMVMAEENPTQIVPSDVVKIIQDAMRETVTNGTAASLQDLPVAAAGKTGTAQWSSEKGPHAWFTGFAPYEDPSLVVTVLVEEGADDYLAVPIAKDIFDWWFTQYPVDTAVN